MDCILTERLRRGTDSVMHRNLKTREKPDEEYLKQMSSIAALYSLASSLLGGNLRSPYFN